MFFDVVWVWSLPVSLILTVSVGIWLPWFLQVNNYGGTSAQDEAQKENVEQCCSLAFGAIASHGKLF